MKVHSWNGFRSGNAYARRCRTKHTHTHTHVFELCMFLSEGERQKFSKTIGPLLKKLKEKEREKAAKEQ